MAVQVFVPPGIPDPACQIVSVRGYRRRRQQSCGAKPPRPGSAADCRLGARHPPGRLAGTTGLTLDDPAPSAA